MTLRGIVADVTDAESRFLENVPTEIGELLDWYHDEQSRAPASQVLLDFAGKFLGAMYEDGAVIPETLSAPAPEILALILLQHQRSPQSTGAWLNLGFSLRRMALYRTQDSEHLYRQRLQSALQAFDRSLQLDPDNNGKNIRAWTGKVSEDYRDILFRELRLTLYRYEVTGKLRSAERELLRPKCNMTVVECLTSALVLEDLARMG